MAAASDPKLERPEGHRLLHIEGLRAAAALSVLVYHATEWWIGPDIWEWPWVPMVRLGPFGVVLFFAVSGFVLYRPWVARRRAGRPPLAVRPYLTRRFARIFPAYWVALGVLTIFPGLARVKADPLPYLALLQIYDTDWASGGLGSAWTLCVELSFYLLLPVYAWVLLRRRIGENAEIAILLALGVGSAVLRGLVYESGTGVLLGNALTGTFSWFVAGMVAATALGGTASGAAAGVRRLAARPGVAGVGAALAAAALIALPLKKPGAERHVAELGLETLLFGLAAFFVLLLAVGPRPVGVLASRVAVALGVVSYGIYLWHFTIAQVLRPSSTIQAMPLPFVFYVGTLLALTLVLATLSYRLIERPLTRAVGSARFSDPRSA